MRYADEDFERLASLDDFRQYYEGLSVADAMEETERLHTKGPVKRGLFQSLALHSRLADSACFDNDLSEQQRNAVIGVVTGMRDTIEQIILPLCDQPMQDRVKTALASTDDYAARFANYPRAAEMIALGARRPQGPYEMGVVGMVMAKST